MSKKTAQEVFKECEEAILRKEVIDFLVEKEISRIAEEEFQKNLKSGKSFSLPNPDPDGTLKAKLRQDFFTKLIEAFKSVKHNNITYGKWSGYNE